MTDSVLFLVGMTAGGLLASLYYDFDWSALPAAWLLLVVLDVASFWGPSRLRPFLHRLFSH